MPTLDQLCYLSVQHHTSLVVLIIISQFSLESLNRVLCTTYLHVFSLERLIRKEKVLCSYLFAPPHPPSRPAPCRWYSAWFPKPCPYITLQCVIFRSHFSDLASKIYSHQFSDLISRIYTDPFLKKFCTLSFSNFHTFRFWAISLTLLFIARAKQPFNQRIKLINQYIAQTH